MNRNDSPQEEISLKEKQSEASGCQNSTPDRCNSLSRPEGTPQPIDPDGELRQAPTGQAEPTTPIAHVVLYQPEIPQNTGNIGRTCVATGAKLWIVRPAGFRFDDKKLRRAGMDYWQHLQLGDANNWEHLIEQLTDESPGADQPASAKRFFYLSKFAEREVWDAEFQRGDVFVFGSESSGLPDRILQRDAPQALRLPMTEHVRSLNLATTAGIVLYEHQRQIRQQQASVKR